MGPFQRQSCPLYASVQCNMDLQSLWRKHTLTMQVAMNALLLSETVYRIMDPGGPAEAERVADMLMGDLPVFARSSMHLQWSPDHISQRCVTPPFGPKALFLASSKPRCIDWGSHRPCRRHRSLLSPILEQQGSPAGATMQRYFQWLVCPTQIAGTWWRRVLTHCMWPSWGPSSSETSSQMPTSGSYVCGQKRCIVQLVSDPHQELLLAIA